MITVKEIDKTGALLGGSRNSSFVYILCVLKASKRANRQLFTESEQNFYAEKRFAKEEVLINKWRIRGRYEER